MACRKKKSLHFNLGFQDEYEGGKNVVYHREHRSKRGRNLFNKENSPYFFKYKNKKWRQKYEDDEEILAF